MTEFLEHHVHVQADGRLFVSTTEPGQRESTSVFLSRFLTTNIVCHWKLALQLNIVKTPVLVGVFKYKVAGAHCWICLQDICKRLGLEFESHKSVANWIHTRLPAWILHCNSLGLTSPHLRRSMPYQTPADSIATTDTEVHRCLSFVSASPPALLAILSRLAGRSQSRGGLGREDEKLKVETFITKIVSEILGNSSSPLRINIDKFGKRVGNVNIGKNKVYCGPIHLIFKAILQRVGGGNASHIQTSCFVL